VDATLQRSKTSSMIASIVSVLLIPVLWMFAFEAIPALKTVQADVSGGRMGPWVFTWGLVWVATLACVVVAWLCYISTNEPVV
jgi:uncharacterized membrane protein YdbT with pleckstrin-like domain